MVNTLTQQMGIVFNPLIHNINQTYNMLANQIGRIADFLVPLKYLIIRFPRSRMLGFNLVKT